ncbi:MAG: FctA domain-containing protein [Eggerthellaceae bacterium]|nr:FctA domain-containing protein [Eggerthellaceae bacterium]
MADPSSMDDWAAILGGETPNTANIGRIWTDKTVSTDTITTSSGSVINRGDSAFITALSALSSTSNVKSSSTTPLDIVLVLDASGSMDDSMDDGTKRIDALKSAANNFVNHIAEQNQGISDSSKQHQVSIVKFSGDKSAAVGNDTYYRGGYKYNYSQVMKAMSPCTDAAAFRNTINSINPAGSTRADYGLQLADSQTSNREDAKKIVIFFTDGSPTSSSGFESEVASSAVSAAKAMKDKKATVYTVGIFSGADPSADPSGASNENKFMHAVSSNYPEAAYTQNSGFWGGWDWNLGTRPDGSDFYKSATNADELKKVFDDISSEIVKGSGYPTNATEGAEHTSGYITFDDALGAYMQVDSFKAIALNGQTFENPTKTTAGNVDTYTFDGTVAMGDKSVSLGNVVITVTKSTDLAVGDKVQVKVPAALIPLHSYNVDQKSMTMTVSDTKPINVVYTSSLKPGVESLLANPDDAMSEYLQANSQEGKASFYSNDWKQGYLGNTIANFEPSSDNIYYYFTSDTPIYTDEACTQRAHQVVAGNTYWYKYSYYEMTDAGSGTVEEKEKVISFDGADAETIEGSIGVNNQGAYFKAGTARLTYLNNLYKAKDNNATGTANDVLNPKWVGAGQVGAYLGNNGKLSVDLPGTLAVTKELKVPDGYSANDFADDSFEFTVAVPDAANKSFDAVVKNANGDKVGDAFTLKFDEEGKASHNLKAGETLYVYGLAGGWNYTVTESDRDGFTQAGTGLTGTITAGGTANAKVVNTYSASGTLKGEDSLKGEKVLTGRDWNSTDKFTFLLEAPEGSVGVPMPEGANNGKATVEVTQPDGTPAGTPVPFNFGDITYTKPGVYTYEIRESEALSVLNPGVSASEALYEVTVTVADEGHTGNLTVTSAEMKKLISDDGEKVEPPTTVPSASFVNEYDTQEVKWVPVGEKKYTDSTDARPLEQGMFHVIACTNDPDAPLPKLDNDQEITGVHNGVTYRGAVVSVDANGAITFPQATYTYGNLGQGQTEKTFTYKIMEVVWDGNNWSSVEDALKDPNFDSAGVTYDPTIWTVNVTLKNDNGVLVLSSQYLKDGVPVQGASFQFANSYDPTPATATIEGSKTLTGRDMADGETFGFELSAADDATQSAVTAGAVTLPAAATVSDAKDGVATGFTFDKSKMSFNKPGEYTFNVNETKWNGEAVPVADGNGMQFDRSTKTVKVTVTDDHTGSLKATTVVSGGPEGSKTYVYSSDAAGTQEKAVVPFKNSYAASGEVGITATKSLTGRDLTEGEFSFAVKYAAGGDDLLTASNKADGSIDFGKLSYTTETLAAMVKNGYAAKTTTDNVPAWTIHYAAYEKIDSLHKLPGGVSAQTQFIPFTVTVVDNGDGTLAATANTGDDGLVFKNIYSTGDPVLVGLSGEKVLKSDAGLTPASIEGKFTFTVTSDDAAAPMPERTTATNDANGNVDFGNIEFTLDDLNKALGSNGTRAADADDETKGASSGEAATGAAGQSTSDQGSAAGADSEEQGNAAASDGTEQGQGAAVVTGEGTGAASVSTAANKVAGAEAADQTSAQSSEPSTRAGVSRSHIFTYKVTENGSAAGVTNDANVTKTVSFKVTDDGNGKLTVERLGAASDPAFAFTNTYSVQPTDSSVTDQVKVTKQLTGRDMAAGEFAFELLEGDKVVATGTNSRDGSVALRSITYTEPGTHSYMLREVGGGTHKAGVEYDGSVFAVTTTVTDNGDGTLSVAHKVDNDANAVGFTNSYAPAATSVTLGASKVLNGKSLEDGEFSFALEGEDGTQLTAGNDANGMVVFPAIQYSETGTYQYTLSEVKGSETGVTYDEAAYAVTVAVEDDDEGSLVATVSYEGGKAPVFNNTYQEPEGPAAADDPVSFVKAAVSGAAKTGDNLLGIAGAIAAVAAVAAAVAVLSRRKRGKHAKK